MTKTKGNTNTTRANNGKAKKTQSKQDRLQRVMTLQDALSKYPHLVEKDLQWIGRPAMGKIYPHGRFGANRTFNCQRVEAVAVLKKQQMKLTDSCQKEYHKALAVERKKVKRDHERAKAKRWLLRTKKRAKDLKNATAFEKLCRKKAAALKQSADLGRAKNISDSKLPLDLWSKILSSLCEDVELKGIRGPSVIARELVKISLVSKELRAAALPAFQYLSAKCRPIEESLAIGRPCLVWYKRIAAEKPSTSNARKPLGQICLRSCFSDRQGSQVAA